MENEVFLCHDGDETCIGTVNQLLEHGNQNYQLDQVVRDIVDGLVYDNDNVRDYAVITLEIR